MSSINANFEAEMVEFAEAGKRALQEMTKMILVDIALKLVERSPVGDPSTWKRQPAWFPKNYKPGTFKNNWHLGVDAEGTDIFFTPDPSGLQSINRIALAIPRFPVGHVYYFSNNLPYAQALEDGHSYLQCPPGGMIALTVREFQSIVDDVQARYDSGERPTNKVIP